MVFSRRCAGSNYNVDFSRFVTPDPWKCRLSYWRPTPVMNRRAGENAASYLVHTLLIGNREVASTTDVLYCHAAFKSNGFHFPPNASDNGVIQCKGPTRSSLQLAMDAQETHVTVEVDPNLLSSFT